ncbi:hypothetical protein KI688_011947 [Linnemannia hyalina]|uniref:Uncharacterized protein n=1 Tax=Linnemannia hyalina TaxID=64524 RepID=A0A9P8BTK7_9FUNG|nr:hypothetical protein KI688_011947 [Linnemannia hyalina]
MADNPPTLQCLVDGEGTSNALLVEIPSSDTVPIKTKETNDPVVPANKHKPIVLNEIDSTTEIDPTDDISNAPPKETIYDIIQRLLRSYNPACSGPFAPEATTSDDKGTPLRGSPKNDHGIPNNDLITFFGVSGCGKTRAVVEMLAQNWGFYLNGSRADKGSRDVATLFESALDMPTRYFSSDKVQNGLNIMAITGCLLISRLMVLRYCLSFGRRDTFTCDRWMLLQVCPGVFDATVPDVFNVVFNAILHACHNQMPCIPFASLEHLLQDRFHQVQDQLSSFTSDSPTNKLLVVLNSAQALSDYGRDCFVSHADPSDLRSLLSPIIHGLRSISGNLRDYCVVTCGAGIGADELEALATSGGIGGNLDQIDRRIVDFPCWETEDQVSMYINDLGEAMSEDDRVMLHTLIPETAIQELFYKLRDRLHPIILNTPRWGFYFNAAANDLGSVDITALMSDIGTRLQPDRKANNRLARTITYLLLLSRLKILQHCLTISGSHQTFTSARWTILQTCSHVFFNDIFAQLFECLLPIFAQYQTPLTESVLVAAVQRGFQATRDLLEEHGKKGGLP